MKTVKLLVCTTALVAVVAVSCSQKRTIEGLSSAQIDSVSYFTGVDLGKQLRTGGFELLDLQMMLQGITDELNNRDARYQKDSAQYVKLLHEFKLKSNIVIGSNFLANNKKSADVVELPSGLQYKMITQGNGATPAAEDTVVVHYRGTLISGIEFDSSHKRGTTSKFALNRVITGWTEGFQHLKEGSKAILYIPSNLAYGERLRAPHITPGSTLIFEVELFEVRKAASPK